MLELIVPLLSVLGIVLSYVVFGKNTTMGIKKDISEILNAK